MPLSQTILLSLLPTILIEYAVLVLLRERSVWVLGASVVINILTNIPLNLFVFYVDCSAVTVLLGEMLVVLVEGLWYCLFLRDLPKAFTYSILCNAISFLIGLLVQLLFVFFLKY